MFNPVKLDEYSRFKITIYTITFKCMWIEKNTISEATRLKWTLSWKWYIMTIGPKEQTPWALNNASVYHGYMKCKYAWHCTSTHTTGTSIVISVIVEQLIVICAYMNLSYTPQSGAQKCYHQIIRDRIPGPYVKTRHSVEHEIYCFSH